MPSPSVSAPLHPFFCHWICWAWLFEGWVFDSGESQPNLVLRLNYLLIKEFYRSILIAVWMMKMNIYSNKNWWIVYQWTMPYFQTWTWNNFSAFEYYSAVLHCFLLFQVLLSSATTEQRKSLITGYDMLTNPAKMGERFKFFAILEKLNDGYVPAGFTALQ